MPVGWMALQQFIDGDDIHRADDAGVIEQINQKPDSKKNAGIRSGAEHAC